MQPQVPPQVMAAALAQHAAGPAGGPPGAGGPPPGAMPPGGAPPGAGGPPGAPQQMDPQQAAQLAGKLGINEQNFPMVKAIVDALSPLMDPGAVAGPPPGAGGPPPGGPPAGGGAPQ